MSAGARVHPRPVHGVRSAAYAPVAGPDLQGMTCETCATPGQTFRLIGTAEALCVDCFQAAHPPATPACPAASRGAARSRAHAGTAPRAARRLAPQVPA